MFTAVPAALAAGNKRGVWKGCVIRYKGGRAGREAVVCTGARAPVYLARTVIGVLTLAARFRKEAGRFEALASCGVKQVAMESTGVYWIPVFEVLDRAGFEVHLVNPRATKQVSGRKSDVLDCQWIRQLPRGRRMHWCAGARLGVWPGL